MIYPIPLMTFLHQKILPKKLMNDLKAYIRDVPDFPKAGILFRDITPLLLDHRAFMRVIDALSERYSGRGVTKIVAIESRGFIFGSPLVARLGVGIVPMRKPGKLPYNTIHESYELEYGEAALEIHDDAIAHGDKVLLIDDVLATGGTAAAAVSLINKLGANVIEAAFVIELAGLHGSNKLAGTPFFSLIKYD